jgi:hypothetical protein
MKQKSFDCVRMKREIQSKILEETAGLSAKQRRDYTERVISSDPVLARIWKNARRTQQTGTK